jgi:hypothetical protein
MPTAAAVRSANDSFDLTDVPAVDARHLALAMRILIEEGQGLVFLRGLDAAARAALEARFWREFTGTTAEGVATLLRLHSLAAAFGARRLRAMLMVRGYALIEPSLAVAARLRLNAAWGFSPQKILSALRAAPSAARTTAEPHRMTLALAA